MNDTTSPPDLEDSNYLPDLASRIQVEHKAVSASLKESLRHSIAAGELLIEAKGRVKHGEWLPWLRDHCTISERTAQLYKRCAKNRDELEKQIRNDVADLTLNEAAAMLAMSSDMKKLLDFARRAEGMDSEELIKHCAKNDIAMFGYHPFGGKYFHELEDPGKLEWRVYALFLIRRGNSFEAAQYDADHLQSRGWRVTMDCRDDEQWYGAWGDRWRKRFGMVISQAAKDDWLAFYESNLGRAISDVEAQQEQDQHARRERRKQKAAA
jgi:hypothetical protein